jgi:hypothetical protein
MEHHSRASSRPALSITMAALKQHRTDLGEDQNQAERTQHSQSERGLRLIASSFEVENFLHVCPPLAFLSRWQRVLHRLHDGPPFLRLGIRSHLAPIFFQIAAVVFQVAEEKVVLEEDGVVLDIAF